MSQFRKELTDLLRPLLQKPPGMTQQLVDDIDDILDRAGVDRDGPPLNLPAPTLAQTASASANPPPARAAGVGRLDLKGLRTLLGLMGDGGFDDDCKLALFNRLSNTKAAALTEADFARVAGELGVAVKIIKAVRKVEAPRGAFDDEGRPTILYEKHIFGKQTGYRYNAKYPQLSSRNQKPTSYGKFSDQYSKLARACELDIMAAFEACSWGAFQILGTNAVACGYASALDMALELTVSEAAHLDSFARFVRMRGLVDELRRCKPGKPDSCIPFVRAYNGPAFRSNNYHEKLAKAAL